jgi:hypothetical protein
VWEDFGVNSMIFCGNEILATPMVAVMKQVECVAILTQSHLFQLFVSELILHCIP